MIIIRVVGLLVFAVALGYTLLRVWHRYQANRSVFRSHIGFTELDGMASLSLLLENGSEEDVWAEEIEIFLSDLVAEQQTAEPTLRGIQKIRQMVRAGDMLPISLCEAIYKAAGNPQRTYSCVLSSTVRYRIGERWIEKQPENYRVRMLGLTASGVRRERKPIHPVPPRDNPRDAPGVVTELK